MTHPGSKLNFMGNEIGQYIEWRYFEGIEYHLVNDFETHAKRKAYVWACEIYSETEACLHARAIHPHVAYQFIVQLKKAIKPVYAFLPVGMAQLPIAVLQQESAVQIPLHLVAAYLLAPVADADLCVRVRHMIILARPEAPCVHLVQCTAIKPCLLFEEDKESCR